MKGTIRGGSASVKSEKQNPQQIFTFLVTQSKIRPGDSGGYNAYFNNKKHSNFLYVYFWFAYHLLFAPFRFRKVGLEQGRYEIHTWLPQQILCGLSNILSIIKLTTTLRHSFEEIRENDPISFFLLFCECSSFVFKTTMFKRMWMNQDTFLRLIRYLNNPHLMPYNPRKMESVTAISIFCGSYSLLSFLRMILGSGYASISDWSPPWLYRRLVAEARYTFLICNATQVSVTPELHSITPTETFLAIVQGLIMQSRFITGFYADLGILVHVLSLWAPASGFTNALYSQIPVMRDSREETPFDLGSSTKVEVERVLKQFEALKNVSILVGESVGNIMLPYIGEALFYYAIYFDDVVMTKDYITRLVLMFFYGSAVSILMLSAEIVRKIRWLKIWLCEQGRLVLIDNNHLAMIFDDVTHYSVGVTASGIFTINYHFVGTIVSVLITYFIIRLQSTQSLIV